MLSVLLNCRDYTSSCGLQSVLSAYLAHAGMPRKLPLVAGLVGDASLRVSRFEVFDNILKRAEPDERSGGPGWSGKFVS